MFHRRTAPPYRWHPVRSALALFLVVAAAFAISVTESRAAVAPTAVTAPATVTGPTLGVFLGVPRFCLNDHTQGSGIPLTTAVNRWDENIAIWSYHESEVGGDCAAAGFPVQHQLEVFLVDTADNETCSHWFNTYTTSNGKKYRTRSILYLHKNNLSCWSTPNRKANFASQNIGIYLGASLRDDHLGDVMDVRTYDTIPYATAPSRSTVQDDIYWYWRKV